MIVFKWVDVVILYKWEESLFVKGCTLRVCFMSCNGREFPIRGNFTQIEADEGDEHPSGEFHRSRSF